MLSMNSIRVVATFFLRQREIYTRVTPPPIQIRPICFFSSSRRVRPLSTVSSTKLAKSSVSRRSPRSSTVIARKSNRSGIGATNSWSISYIESIFWTKSPPRISTSTMTKNSKDLQYLKVSTASILNPYAMCVQHSLTVGEGRSPCLKKVWMPGSGRGKDLHSFMTLAGQIGGAGGRSHGVWTRRCWRDWIPTFNQFRSHLVRVVYFQQNIYLILDQWVRLHRVLSQHAWLWLNHRV